MATKKTTIIIAGPTAVGKTSVAIEVAKHFNTEIISADSRQCYKELNIGVARPAEEQLKEVKHHFIASHSVHEKITAVDFEKLALQKVSEIFLKHDVAVMVGGTGLYIKAFCEGMDEIPEVPEEIRNEIIYGYKKNGLEWLQQQLKKSDPEFYKIAEIKNPNRLMRALEVFTATRISILDFRKGKKVKRNFDLIKVALELPKEQLHYNIEMRVDNMLKQGLIEEAKSFIPYRHLNALQTVGYKELFDYFDGDYDLEHAVELIKKNTRKYARRQVTWFRKNAEFKWMKPDANELLHYVGEQML